MRFAAILFISLLSILEQTSFAKTPLCENLFRANTDLATLFSRIDSTADLLKERGQLTAPILWRRHAAPYGLNGLDLPETFGGANLTIAELAKVFEHVGQYSLDLRDAVGAGHARILTHSQDPSSKLILKAITEGKAYAAIAITEKKSGSDIRAMESISEKVDEGYLLTGEKMFNARFSTATHVMIVTNASASNSGRLNIFALPTNYKGLTYQELNAHGLQGNSFGGVSFNKLFVPEKFRIGEKGQGGEILKDHFLYWRLMMTAAAIGTGKGALSQAVQRMRERDAFGGPIGRFTHLQQALAEHTAKLHMVSLLIKDAAEKMDKGETVEAAPLVAMAKAEGVEWALKAADFAMELFAAEGYTDLVDLGQRVSDLQGLRVADGTTHLMRQQVIRNLYGEDFWLMAIGRPSTTFAQILSRLQSLQIQNGMAFIDTTDYKHLINCGGGGACATVTAVNLIQAIKIFDKQKEVSDPNVLIRKAFQDLPELKEGRVTNTQFESLLNYLKMYLSNTDYKIRISKDVTTSDILGAQPNEVKILIYKVTDPEGVSIGRHFVILKETSANDMITVVDPYAPSKDYTYNLVPHGNRIELIRPGGNNSWYYEMDTLFTLTLKNESL